MTPLQRQYIATHPLLSVLLFLKVWPRVLDDTMSAAWWVCMRRIAFFAVSLLAGTEVWEPIMPSCGRLIVQRIVRLGGMSTEDTQERFLGKDVMSAIERNKLGPGSEVRIVQKKDQRSGTLTSGVVKDVLTKSPTHPHGIKVRLETGEVGRVKEILSKS
jgi:uncharacterized repeat protein (TIGR03833 family)